MFDRVISFFRDLPLPGGAQGTVSLDDPRVAAAALMHHVMDADGERQDGEWERIKQLLGEHYRISGRQLDELVEAGEAAEHEAVDLYAFTSVLNRHLDEGGKIAFIHLMWDIVYADGVLHELEDNTLWRIAELIGVDRRERVLARKEAAGRSPGARGVATEE